MREFGTGLIAWIGYGSAFILALVGAARVFLAVMSFEKNPFKSRQLMGAGILGLGFGFLVALVTRAAVS